VSGDQRGGGDEAVGTRPHQPRASDRQRDQAWSRATFEFGPQQEQEEHEDRGLHAVDRKIRELGIRQHQAEKQAAPERSHAQVVEPAPAQQRGGGEERGAHPAEQPQREVLPGGACHRLAQRGQEHAERRGEGVDAFARGEDKAVSLHEIAARTERDEVVLPHVSGVACEAEGQQGGEGDDEPF